MTFYFQYVNRDDSFEMNDSQLYDLKDYFLKINHDSILITTRLRQLRQYGQDRQLGRMNDIEEAKVLRCKIKQSIKDNDNQATNLIHFIKHYLGLDRIVKKMSDLSFAFAHAGFYIHGTNTNVSDYIRYYEDIWEKLHNNKITRLKDYSRSILFTYIISYEYVQRNDANAAKLFNLFVYLDHLDL